LEYTRINPWVYTHKYDATTYTSNSYLLGHWLGQNGQLVYFAADYRWLRSLALKFSFQHIIKGPLGPESIHYSMPWAQEFLAGPLFRQSLLGLEARWEPYRGLFMTANVILANQTDDVTNRYPTYSDKLMMSAGVVYNLFDH
ncbi:MAG TPA: hypothetical protein VI758_04705, partial [Bacteroidota bacterium]